LGCKTVISLITLIAAINYYSRALITF